MNVENFVDLEELGRVVLSEENEIGCIDFTNATCSFLFDEMENGNISELDVGRYQRVICANYPYACKYRLNSKDKK